MKRLLSVMLVIFLLTGCRQIVDSLYEPVNAEDDTLYRFEAE